MKVQPKPIKVAKRPRFDAAFGAKVSVPSTDLTILSRRAMAAKNYRERLSGKLPSLRSVNKQIIS